MLNGVGGEDVVPPSFGSRRKLRELHFFSHEGVDEYVTSNDEIDTGTWPVILNFHWDMACCEVGPLQGCRHGAVITMLIPSREHIVVGVRNAVGVMRPHNVDKDV